MTNANPQLDGAYVGLEEALSAARAEAHEKGMSEGYSKGYAAGRSDAVAIMGGEQAKGRHGLAAELAGNVSINPELAETLLAKSAKEGGMDYAKSVKQASPDVGPNPEDQAKDDRQSRVEHMRSLGALVSGRAK